MLILDEEQVRSVLRMEDLIPTMEKALIDFSGGRVTQPVRAMLAVEEFEGCNGKLRDELLNSEIFYTLKEAQVLIERWRKHYNTVRPHSALGYKPPAPEVWTEGRPDLTFVTQGLRPNRAFPTQQILT